MHQSLYKKYALNSYIPKVTVIEQLPPQENNDENRQTQSPCPSNWSDYLLHVEDDTDDKNPKNRPTCQSTHNFDWYKSISGCMSRCKYDSKTTSNSAPGTENTKTNGKTKQKTRPPYTTRTWEKSQKQDGPEQK